MKDSVIVVTGAFGALGTAITGELASRGALVAALDRTEGKSDSALVLAGVDAAHEESVQAALTTVVDVFGHIDGLVNVAGGFVWETIFEGVAATWDSMYQLNLRTSLMMSQAALRHMPAGGAIVNVGAAAASKATAGMGAYAASKSAVARLTEALADERKGKGLRVNAVLPSIMDTPANRLEMPNANFATWVTVQEVAKVVSFLLSSDASVVTGALIPISGRI